MQWLTLLVQAQGPGGGSPMPGCAGGGLSQMVMIGLMFGVFYLLILRPQQKKAKEHRDMLSNLKKGDEIITSGGIVGRVSGLTDRFVTLEVAEKIRLRVLRSHVLGKNGELKDVEEAPAAQPPA